TRSFTRRPAKAICLRSRDGKAVFSFGSRPQDACGVRLGGAGLLRSVSRRLAEPARFSGAGLANTLVTIAIYEALVGFIAAPWAYSIAWCVGLFIVAATYPAVVYRVQASMPSRIFMAAV